ncbi:poly-gamma-glutamate system protein [Prosthecomicrobium sp. N25]|uniref:poly-gamma-glutamate system protein n=1 Tax=Prosthecomicrobium sp. N25 TaxID=3129254 RepID=UPI003077EE2B
MSGPPAVPAPQVAGRWGGVRLALAAVLCLGLWQVVERVSGGGLHPRLPEMLAAAETMREATRAIAAEKSARGLMQPPEVDPNRTGLIGPELTGLTTTMGDLASKRTVTNPDFAAALLRMVDGLGLPRGAPAVVVLSGSFVGADIASMAALEAIGIRPVVVVSLSASMYGATDPGFTLLDMLGTLRRRGILATRPSLAVFGGEAGVAHGMEPEVVAALRASAAREGVELIEEPPFPALAERLADRIRTLLGGRAPALLVNVGGALVALGTCPQSFELPPGLSRRPLGCSAGAPGLVQRLAGDGGVPVLHVINIRRMALDSGLPFDPRPLPVPGRNPAVYGRSRAVE